MTPNLLVRLDLAVRRMVPFLVSMGLVIMTAVPTRLPGFSQIAPCWPMIGIFYWSIYRPDLLPAWGAFILGLLADVVSNTPIGINGLVFILIRGTVISQRRFFLTNGFRMSWATFAIIALGSMGLEWTLYAVLQGAAVDPQILLWQYVILTGLFPLMTLLLAYTQMVLLRDI